MKKYVINRDDVYVGHVVSIEHKNDSKENPHIYPGCLKRCMLFILDEKNSRTICFMKHLHILL